MPIVEWEGGGEKGKWFLEQAKGEGHLLGGQGREKGGTGRGKGEKNLCIERSLLYILSNSRPLQML